MHEKALLATFCWEAFFRTLYSFPSSFYDFFNGNIWLIAAVIIIFVQFKLGRYDEMQPALWIVFSVIS